MGNFFRNVRGVRPSPLVEGWQVGKLGKSIFSRGVRLVIFSKCARSVAESIIAEGWQVGK